MIGNLFAIYVFPFAIIYGVFWAAGILRALLPCVGVYMVAIQLDPAQYRPPDHKRFALGTPVALVFDASHMRALNGSENEETRSRLERYNDKNIFSGPTLCSLFIDAVAWGLRRRCW